MSRWNQEAPAVALQLNLLGGCDVLVAYEGRGGATNAIHCSSTDQARKHASLSSGVEACDESIGGSGIRLCPRCWHLGSIRRDFGFRRVQGRVIAQSWCRQCRSGRGPAPKHERKGK